MHLKLFDKQTEAFLSKARVTAYVGGIQCGKTVIGAVKARAKFELYTDPRDSFIVGAPNYKTLKQATLPALLHTCKGMGVYKKVDSEFILHDGRVVYIRTATNPESMEGITNCRFAWIDEAGLVSRYFIENVEGRLAFKEGEGFYTTTPYSMNWLSKVAKDAKDGKIDSKEFKLIQLRSIDSPYFPKAEYERQRRKLHPRRFRMKYEGLFGKMEGLVFPHLKIIPAVAMPHGTRYVAGVDWGYHPDPFCITVRAITPDGVHYRVDEFYKNFMTINDCIRVAKAKKQVYGIDSFYCDPSQPGYIEEFNRNDLCAYSAKNDIRLGLDKHYELISDDRFFVFEETNPIGIDEYQTYRYREERELMPEEDPKVKDSQPVDQDNHGIDADRYVTMETAITVGKFKVPGGPIDGPPVDNQKRLKWLQSGGSSRFTGD